MKDLIFTLLLTLGMITNTLAQNAISVDTESQIINKSDKYPSLLDLGNNFNLKRTTHKVSPLLPNPISIHHTSFFCKMERKVDLNSNLPLRLRLGSLDYVNKLEGK